MESPPDSIFISYSRADGREFAEGFEGRLEHEGIRSWRDLKSMEAGNIRPQVLRAIEDAKHFVLILCAGHSPRTGSSANGRTRG